MRLCVCVCAAMSPVAMMQRSLPSIFSSAASSLPQGVMVMQVEQEQQPQPRRPTQAPRFSATESAGPQLLGRHDDQPRLERPFFAMGACGSSPSHSPSPLTPCEPHESTNTRTASGRD
jgi:hypothetical protein